VPSTKINQTDLFSCYGQIVEDTFSDSLTEKKREIIRTGKKQTNKQTNNQRNRVKGKERELRDQLNPLVLVLSSVTAFWVVIQDRKTPKRQ